MNQFALPREQSGGTRHVDLYGGLKGWSTSFVAGDINHTTSQRFTTSDGRFKLVRIPSYSGNGLARVFGWGWFTLRASIIALTSRADVFVGSSPHPLAPAATLLAAKARRRPFVLEIRDLWPESIVAAGLASERNVAIRALREYESFLYRQADAIIGVTPGWKDYFADLGVPTSKIWIVPNGTSSSAIPIEKTREELDAGRASRNIESPAAIFAGSHGPKDGIGLIVDAAERVPELNFYLYGGGSDKAVRIAEAERRGIENIHFRDGVSKEELPELLSLFDIGLHVVSPLPVFDRGMSPNKLFDYLAAGLPVVSNAKHPLRHVLQDDQVGVLTLADGLADGISKARRADPSTIARWAWEGQRIVTEEYSRERQREVIGELLKVVSTLCRFEV